MRKGTSGQVNGIARMMWPSAERHLAAGEKNHDNLVNPVCIKMIKNESIPLMCVRH
jgi:hypothetical protein